MVIYKAYKFRIYPDKTQENMINKNIGSSRFVFNYYLDKKIKEYKESNKNLSLKEIKHDLVLLKNEHVWLKENDSMSLTNSLEDLEASFTNYFEKRGSYPKLKAKGRKDSYKTDMIRSTYKGKRYENINVDIKNKTIKLPKIGIVKIRGYRYLKEFDKDIKNVTISKEGNKYYASVCVSEEVIEKPFILSKALGIDLGIKDLVITSNGIKYKKLDISRVKKHIKDLQRKLSRCEKKSIRRYKLKLKIKRVYMKLKNMRKYYIHEITKDLVKNNDLIVTEDLKVKNMIEEKRLSKYIANASFSEIIRVLKYKSEWSGKKLIKVNTFFPSSQICHRCGFQNRKVKDLSIRIWECEECGCKNDRDINSSENILFEGVRLFYKSKYC